jgi:hypothetical protein
MCAFCENSILRASAIRLRFGHEYKLDTDENHRLQGTASAGGDNTLSATALSNGKRCWWSRLYAYGSIINITLTLTMSAIRTAGLVKGYLCFADRAGCIIPNKLTCFG